MSLSLRRVLYRVLLIITLIIHALPSTSTSVPSAEKLATLLFVRECGGKKRNIVHWHINEQFPSFGIGHFIWMTPQAADRFAQTFPELINELKKSGEEIPGWLLDEQQQCKATCPWTTRKEFLVDRKTARVRELKQLLTRTQVKQAQFVLDKFYKQLPEMLKYVPEQKREAVSEAIELLKKSATGMYALIDYVHFKGLGTNPKEQYHGKGWGLLQVLQEMKRVTTEQEALLEFVHAATQVLEQRVAQAPTEQQFLPGWKARIKSYQHLKL